MLEKFECENLDKSDDDVFVFFCFSRIGSKNVIARKAEW